MGRPKQLLPWQKTTFIRHTVAEAAATKAKAVYVVTGAHANMVENQLREDPVVLLHNENWKKGMGSSIAYGVHCIENMDPNTRGILIAVCDQPLMDRDFMQRLITRFLNGKHGIVGTSYDEFIGVPALFESRYFSLLKNLKGDTGARSLISRYEKDSLGVLSGGKAVDIDDEEAYETLKTQHKGRF